MNSALRPLLPLILALFTAVLGLKLPEPMGGYVLLGGLLVIGVVAALNAGGGASLDQVSDLVRRAMKDLPLELPSGASPELVRLRAELETLLERKNEELASAKGRERLMGTEVVQGLEVAIRESTTIVEEQGKLARETDKQIVRTQEQAKEETKIIEGLLGGVHETSATVMEIARETHSVATGLEELSNGVRETVSSIEEMTYSIKEVAKNVDALSLTAEETSSSMNEMDVSIDQVQSNANETARLSEDVSVDADRGADAIMKTISEIYRIKESSLEAVNVIQLLGTRIDAIGQIVNVIDDVAEQTNLLALNAAIIAAQAGEQGKGFAVVADEIKDLAERAGTSTREITDLIKTVQAESKNAITAVERGAAIVDRGVEVSNEAERALKKILDSSQKSTSMVRAIARATVEQAKGSKQVTDAIGRIAETVQQIAAATSEQARGSELIIRSTERMRELTQQVEVKTEEHGRSAQKVAATMDEFVAGMKKLTSGQKAKNNDLEACRVGLLQIQETTRRQDALLQKVRETSEKLRKA